MSEQAQGILELMEDTGVCEKYLVNNKITYNQHAVGSTDLSH
jgi:hypothetical protein